MSAAHEHAHRHDHGDGVDHENGNGAAGSARDAKSAREKKTGLRVTVRLGASEPAGVLSLRPDVRSSADPKDS